MSLNPEFLRNLLPELLISKKKKTYEHYVAIQTLFFMDVFSAQITFQQ